MRNTDAFIADLAGDLHPVEPMRALGGFALIAGCVAVSIASVAVFLGLWSGPVQGDATVFFYLANGLLAMLGTACAASVIRMANPAVGNRYDGAYWTLAMFAIFPIVGIVTLVDRGLLEQVVSDPFGLQCALTATAVASFTAIGLTIWLRRGAPANLARASLLTGLAAGALGSAAHGLSCPIDTLGHLSVWHVLPVGLAGLAGRMVLPRLIAW